MFSAQAGAYLAALPDAAELAELIRQTLALDPRPAYRQADAESRLYGMRLGQFDVRWRVHTGQVVVEEIAPAEA
jgi:hypothetical protein